MKKPVLSVCLLFALTGCVRNSPSKPDDPDVPVVDDTQIVFNKDTLSADDLARGSFLYSFEGLEYTFKFSGLSLSNDTFTLTGDFYNETKIYGMTELKLVDTNSSSYHISYSYEFGDYDFTSKTLQGDHSYVFNNDGPSFFSLEPTESITFKSLYIYFSGVEKVNPFSKLPETPKVETEPHQYHQKEYVDFPSFGEPTPGLSYHLSDDGTYYIVDNYFGTMEMGDNHYVIFPSEYNNLPVKEIGSKGFAEKWYIFGLYIPSTIEKIANEAFYMCGLEKIYFDAINCEDFIPRNAIFGPVDTHNHQNIDLVIGPNVKHIPAYLLMPNMMTPNVHPNVKSISFDKNCKLESIGEYAFYGLNRITRVDLPDTVTEIGDYAFYETGLEEIQLEKVESIGDGAFRFCSKLEYISLPNTLESLGDYAFNADNKLVQIDLSKTKVTEVGFATFKDCSSLKRFKLSSETVKVGESAFEGCSSLEEVVLPEDVEVLDVKTFKDCVAVNYVELNESLKTLGNSAFEGCLGVNDLIIKSTNIHNLELNNKVFMNFGSNKLNVYVAKTVNYLPNNLFYSTSIVDRLAKIKTLSFFSPVNIGDNAFFGQENVEVKFCGFKTDVVNFHIGNNNDVLNDIQGRDE